MSFIAPAWLLALVPWGGLAVYLLLGRRNKARVPFLDLWRGPVKAPAVRRSLNPYPLWIACLLLAGLFAIMSASQPAISGGAALSTPATQPSVQIQSLAARGSQAMVRVLNQSP